MVLMLASRSRNAKKTAGSLETIPYILFFCKLFSIGIRFHFSCKKPTNQAYSQYPTHTAILPLVHQREEFEYKGSIILLNKLVKLINSLLCFQLTSPPILKK